MIARLEERLAPQVEEQAAPEGGSLRLVDEEGIWELARQEGLEPAEVMAQCLELGIWPRRFVKNRGVLSTDDQARLLRSRAAVIGAGGLGGMVILLLARVGLGALTVCDGDRFDQTNLNRQFLSRPDRLGQAKAEVAAEEVAAVNPACRVRAVVDWAGEENLPAILEEAQVALDCLDNLAARFVLEGACRRLGVPYVHGAIAGWEGFVMTVAPGEPGLEGMYGPAGGQQGPGAEKLLGVPTITPAICAAFQALEAVRLLLGKRGLGPGQVMHLDLEALSLESFRLG